MQYSWVDDSIQRLYFLAKDKDSKMVNKIDISKLSLQELRELNLEIQERFEYLKQAESYKALAKLEVGDTVSFQTHEGETIRGTIMRLNKKSVTIVAEDRRGWKVDPILLRKVTSKREMKPKNIVHLVKN